MRVTRREAALQEQVASLRAESAVLRKQVELYEAERRERRLAERRLAQQYDNLFAYTGGGRGGEKHGD